MLSSSHFIKQSLQNTCSHTLTIKLVSSSEQIEQIYYFVAAAFVEIANDANFVPVAESIATRVLLDDVVLLQVFRNTSTVHVSITAVSVSHIGALRAIMS